MVLKILKLELQQDLLKFAIVFEIFDYFCSFLEFNDHYWPTRLSKSCRWFT